MPHKVLDPTLATFVPAMGLAEAPDDALTLADFRARLTKRFGNRDDLTTDDIDGFVNEAVLDIASSLDIPTLIDALDFSAALDQDLYQTETSIAWIEAAAIASTTSSAADGWPLAPVDMRAWRRLPESIGTPTHYALHGNNMIVLWPRPTAARILSLDVRIMPPKLEGADDQAIFGVEWDRAILLKARAIGFSSLLEFTSAQIAENEYINYIRTRINKRAARRTGQIGGLRPIRKAEQLQSARDLVVEPGD